MLGSPELFWLCPCFRSWGCPGVEGCGGTLEPCGLLQGFGQGVQGLLIENGPAVPFKAGKDGLAVFLQGFAETGAGDQAPGVVEVEPADLAVGSGAQLKDGDDAAEVVESGVGGSGSYFQCGDGLSEMARGNCQYGSASFGSKYWG